MAPLPPRRRERLEQVQSNTLRREQLCAWTLLRLAVWKSFGWQELPRIAWTEQGKPWFPDWKDVYFNLSHTAVLVGLSDRPIGVDIERVRPVSDKVMGKIGDVSSEEDFFRRWVELEAKGKRSGRGVMAMLDEGDAPWGDTEYHPLILFPGYAAGTALSRGYPVPKVKIYAI